MQPPKEQDRQRRRYAARRESILSLVANAGAAGISSAQIYTQLGLCNRLVGTLVSQYKAAGLLHSAGSPMSRLYFTDAALASARQAELDETEDERRRQAAEQARERTREADRRRQAARRAVKRREDELLGRIASLEQELAERAQAGAETAAPPPAQPSKKRRSRTLPPGVQPKKGPLRASDPRPGLHQVIMQPAPLPAPVAIAEAQRRPSGEVIVPANVKRTVAPSPPGRYEASGPVIGGFATLRPGHYLPEAGFSSYLDLGAA